MIRGERERQRDKYSQNEVNSGWQGTERTIPKESEKERTTKREL